MIAESEGTKTRRSNHNLTLLLVMASMLLVLLITAVVALAETTITLSSDKIALVVNKDAGEFVSSPTLRVYAQSSQDDMDDWSVNYKVAGPLRGPNGRKLSTRRVEIATPYTSGYTSARGLNLVAKSGVATPLVGEVGSLSLRIRWSGLATGTYTGQLVSPDGGPTINVSVKILQIATAATETTITPTSINFDANSGPGKYPGSSEISVALSPKNRSRKMTVRYLALRDGKGNTLKRIKVNNGVLKADKVQNLMLPKSGKITLLLPISWDDVIGTYTGSLIITDSQNKAYTVNLIATIRAHSILSLSEESISFTASSPGKHKADKVVTIQVGSSAGTWAVNAEATDLIPAIDGNAISRKHLGIKASAKGKNTRSLAPDYMSLGSPLKVLKGATRNASAAGEMAFQLETTMKDRAGEYRGKITFTLLESP